ncbi:MAG: DUF1987 domain-containing protein [Bacteroidales bacterium]|nr:DUF1987 domain-containing protein [Bacteroidales bacterium]
MQKLIITPTKSTFGINFDPAKNVFEITGNSFPPNAMEFYEPIVDWVRNYFSGEVKDPVTINFKVNYYNTSSSKYIFKILELFHEHNLKTRNVKIKWYSHETEDELYEDWRSLIQDLDLPHEFVYQE